MRDTGVRTRPKSRPRSCNEDSLSGERHAGTFECNNTKDGPRPVGWDQANQGIGQRSILHLRKEGLSPLSQLSPSSAAFSMLRSDAIIEIMASTMTTAPYT